MFVSTPSTVTCAACPATFTPTPSQARRSRGGERVYCCRACRPKPGPAVGRGANDESIAYMLGAYRHTSVQGDCPCLEPATRYAVAMLHGEVIVLPVCDEHARTV